METLKAQKNSRDFSDEEYPHSDITQKIIGCAIEVYKTLGPGFKESTYENALIYEFNKAELKYEQQKPITVPYKDTTVGGHRLDFLIEDAVVIELKSVKEIEDIHKAQVLTYLKATGFKVGLLINFAKSKIDVKRMIL